MIEKLQDGEFRESVIAAKVNEVIDAFNEHQHEVHPVVDNLTSSPHRSVSSD